MSEKLTDDLVWLRTPQATWLRCQVYRGETPPHQYSFGGCEVVAYYGTPKNWHALYLNLAHRSDDGFGDWTEDEHTYRGEMVRFDQNAKLPPAEKARRKEVIAYWQSLRPEQYTPPKAIEVPKRPGFLSRILQAVRR